MQMTIDIPDELARQLEPERERLAEIIRRGLGRCEAGALSPVAEVFEFLANHPTPSQIIAFQPSEPSTLRLRILLDRNRDGTLCADEEAELDTLKSLNDFFALIKLRAQGNRIKK